MTPSSVFSGRIPRKMFPVGATYPEGTSGMFALGGGEVRKMTGVLVAEAVVAASGWDAAFTAAGFVECVAVFFVVLAGMAFSLVDVE
jgi:hypothetical protein